VESVAAVLAARHGVAGPAVGQGHQLAVSAGTVALRECHRHGMDQACGETDDPIPGADSYRLAVQGELSLVFGPELLVERRRIVEWSRRSRARMVRTLAELDYSGWADDGGLLAMVTLTLPGWWEVVAPDGPSYKRLMRAFEHRWRRAIGPWRGLWKLEFQRRGAPHTHMLLRVPALVSGQVFETWLSRTWADVCLESLCERDALAYIDLGEYDKHAAAGTAVDFSGVRFSDPRRTAIYFLKHSAKTTDGKEYQNVPPVLWQDGGPGRFWGYWGLSRAVVWLELPRADYVRARRILRHVTRARSAAAAMGRARYDGQGVWRMRHWRSPGFGCRGGGFVIVNDGLALALDLSRALLLP